MWALTCPQCEDHLRHDALWSTTAASIPETPDEIAAREANDKRTSAEQAQRSVTVMERLAEMPDALRNIGPDMAQALIGLLAQLQGSAQSPPADPPQPDEPPADSEPHDALPDDLDELSMADLRKIASDRGVPVRRSREDMVATLKEHLAP